MDEANEVLDTQVAEIQRLTEESEAVRVRTDAVREEVARTAKEVSIRYFRTSLMARFRDWVGIGNGKRHERERYERVGKPGIQRWTICVNGVFSLGIVLKVLR